MNDDGLDLGIGDLAHGLAHVGRAAGAPAAGLGAALRAQHPVAVRPLVDRQFRRERAIGENTVQ